MEKQIINELFQKYLRNECTPAEIDRLMELLDNPENRDIEEELILVQLQKDLKPAGYTNPVLKEQLDDKLRVILQNIGTQQAPVSKRLTIPWLRVAAAASIILVLLASGYMLWNKPSKQVAGTVPEIKKAAPEDVAPGGNKAILTLGNGGKIVLDSINNGVLAMQGNTSILKLASGELAYKSPAGQSTEIVYNTLTTPAGGQYQLTLPDGTKVWLDAASSIRYPTAFTGIERRVAITGQVYFEVAKNEKLPFIVQHGAINMKVLGTHFNVNAYDDENTVKTTLLEGSIKVSRDATQTILKPGQQVQVAKNGGFKMISNADVEEAIAWKNGFFQFNRCDLQTVMRQLSRWYDVEVVYQGNIPSQEFGGKMERDLNLSEVLEGLGSLVHFKIENKKLIVMP